MEIEDLKKMGFEEAYCFLQEKDIGFWDNVNDVEIIREYCKEQISKGIPISHILQVLENNESNKDLYEIWLGNSMSIPSPINNIDELLDALGLTKEELKEVKNEI